MQCDQRQPVRSLPKNESALRIQVYCQANCTQKGCTILEKESHAGTSANNGAGDDCHGNATSRNETQSASTTNKRY